MMVEYSYMYIGGIKFSQVLVVECSCVGEV